MRSRLVLWCASICMFLFSCVYGYEKENESACKNNNIVACALLLKEAKIKKDSEKTTLYTTKLFDIMETACKKDYQTCLTLARIYEAQSPQNRAIEAIKNDIKNFKIPNTNLIETDKDFVPLLRNPDSKKSLIYYEKSVSLLENTCYDSDVAACLFLRYFYEYGIGVAQNRPKAERLFSMSLELATRECMLGNMASCELLKGYPQYEQTIANDTKNLARKCEEKDEIACYQMSLYYTQGFYTQTKSANSNDVMDFVKAAGFLKKACTINMQPCNEWLFPTQYVRECLMDNTISACSSIANMRPEFLSLACEGGDMQSCYESRNLAVFNNTKRYIKLLQRVCKSGIIESCVALSQLYEEGERVPKSREKALNFMQRACAWSMKKDSGGNYCYLAGLGYEKGEFVKQDLEKAMEAYQYACEASNENALACERLGILYENYKQNMPKAMTWYEKACNANKDSIFSCMRIAKNLADGEYLEFAIEKAVPLYEELLGRKDADDGEIYFLLAHIYSAQTLYDKGARNTKENSMQDYAKALQYYKKACTLGVQGACEAKPTFPDFIQECKANNVNMCYQLAALITLLQEDSSYKNMFGLDTESILGFVFHDEFITNESTIKKGKPKSREEAIKQAQIKLYGEACKGGIVAACVRLHAEIKSDFSADSALQEAMCSHLQTHKDGKEICIAFAQNALREGAYKKVVDALAFYYDEWAQKHRDSKKSIQNEMKNTEDTQKEGFIESQSNEDSKVWLDMLVQGYFYERQYKEALAVYKLIYAYDIPNDYYYLAQMYSNGFGVKQDYARAYNIYKLTPSPRNYLGLGQMYANGSGVQRSLFEAKDYYKLACPLDSDDVEKVESEACVQMGSLIYSEGDFQSAQEYYLKACSVGYYGSAIVCAKE